MRFRISDLLVALAVLATAVFLPSSSPVNAQPLSGWSYYRPVTVENYAGDADLTDYPVKIVLSAENFEFGNARPDGADLRVTRDDFQTPLSHWIESWDRQAERAVVWVKVPRLDADTSERIYLRYGNGSARPASNGYDTFRFFDSFGGMNATRPLTTPTYDGSGQAVHPDIVYVPAGWNGYKYWMAMTPYPEGVDDYENPSVLASHDGITWVEPLGILNPLAPMPPAPGHNDDPDMLLVGNEMVIYYNETNADGNTYIKRLASTDGVNWSTPATVITIPNFVMSPTVLYEDGVYYMWYLHSEDGCYSGHQDIYLRTSSDGIVWPIGTEVAVAMNLPDWVIWHFDVQKSGDDHVMVCVAYPDDSVCNNTWLYLATSSDKRNWTVLTTPILSPSLSGWDDGQVYRASFLVDGSFFRIWYSARSTGHDWWIGYTEGELALFQGPFVHRWDDTSGSVGVATVPARSGNYSLWQVGGNPYPQVFKNLSGAISFSAWLYDDMNETPEHLAILRVWDAGSVQYPQHAIGVGYYTEQSEDYYSYHTEGWQYTTTSLPRTMGWHKLSIDVKDSSCDLRIDQTLVATLGVLEEAGIAGVSLDGYTGGEHWFDDAYVRAFSEPEPIVIVGQEGAITDVATNEISGSSTTGLKLVIANPLRGGTSISFFLPDLLPVSLSIVDVQGRLVATLVNARLQGGWHRVTWDGREDQGPAVGSGVYFCTLEANGRRETKKMVLSR